MNRQLSHLAVVAITVALVMSLSGCSVPVGEAPSAQASASASSEGAAARFVAAVCPANKEIAAFNTIWTDNTSPLESIVSAATSAGQSTQIAADAFSAAEWPGADPKDITLLHDDYVLRTADYVTIAAATDLNSLSSFTFTYSQDALAASTRVAQSLGVTSNC